MSIKALTMSLIAVAVLSGVVPGRVVAQTPWSSTISGIVFDSAGVSVSGATVTIAAPTLVGGPQTAATGPDGGFRFSGLPAGTYDVSATRQGLQLLKRSGVQVPAGGTVVIDFTLQAAGVASEVEVRGRSPMVDVRSAAVPVRIEGEMLHALPTPRAIESIINLAPGIIADVSFGGSQRSNEILLDGMRATDPVLQEPLVRGNYNWVESVQVVALGASAEHGGFTGAAAFATLRSGTNRFRGLGEFWTTRPGWVAENTQELSDVLRKQFASRQLLDSRDTSVQVGGPIRRDRLWFFSGLQLARFNDRPAGFTGPGSRDEGDRQFILKPTASLSPVLRVEGFIGPGRRTVEGEGIGPLVPIETSNDVRHRQTTWSARATWTPSASTFAEFRHSGYTIRVAEEPHPPGTRAGPPAHYDYGTALWSVNTNYYFDQRARIGTTAASLTHVMRPSAGGSHELKAGFEHEATRARQEYGLTAGRVYYDYFGEPGEVELWNGEIASATTQRWMAYVQDSWAVTHRLTVTPGVRLERNRGSVPGKASAFATDTIAPRVGVAWDVNADHRTVVRMHYGRYYDAIFASRIMQEDTTGSGNPHVFAYVVGPDRFVEYFRASAEDLFTIDENIRHSHVDQLVLGVERELMRDVSLQAQYIRRRFDDFMGLVDTVQAFQPVERVDPGPDNRPGTSDDGGRLTVFNATNPGSQFSLYTNPENAFNQYDAVQFVGRKRHSRNWQMQASYTWSRNQGTVGNRWHVNAARYDLGQSGTFVNPNSAVNADGRAPFDPTHEAKVLGSYRLTWAGGVLVSGVYRYTTGQAWGRVATITGLRQGSQRVRVEPRGTRRAPALNTLALRVEKTLTLPRTRGALGVFLDAFNVSNQGAPHSDVTNPVSEFSGPSLGQPNAWLDPRLFRAGIRFSF